MAPANDPLTVAVAAGAELARHLPGLTRARVTFELVGHGLPILRDADPAEEIDRPCTLSGQ